jgi:hypothetical protein
VNAGAALPHVPPERAAATAGRAAEEAEVEASAEISAGAAH